MSKTSSDIPAFNQQEICEIAEALNNPDTETRLRAAKKLAAIALNSAQSLQASQELAKIIEQQQYNESHFETLFQNAPDGIIYVSLNANITKFNKAFAEMHGYTIEEMQELTLQDLDLDDLSEIVPERLKRAKEGEELQFEVRHRHKNGNIMYLEATQCHTRLGGEDYAVGFHRDITNRKKTEQALIASEHSYRELINGMTDTAWVIDVASGKIIDVNRAAEETLGYSKEELLSIGLEGIDSAYAPSEIEAMIKSMPEDRLQVFETQHQTKDGKLIPIEICSSIINYHGKEAVLCICRDIAERKKIEVALLDKTATIEATMEASSAGVLVVDDNSTKLLINRRFGEIFGVPPEIMQHPDDQKLLEFVSNLAVNSEKFRQDAEYLYDHPLEVRTEEIEFNGGLTIERYTAPVIGSDCKRHGRIWTFRDITERKRLEEVLRESGIRNPLTNLYNRRYFDDKVKELEKTRRQQYPISVFYIDIDGLKIVNDNWGHEAGDMLIKRVAQILKETFRPEDCVAHWGGDEFAILLNGAGEDQIPSLIDRLNANVAANNQRYPKALLSISFGTATAIDGSMLSEAIIDADNNMLAIKQAKGDSRKSRGQQ